MVSGRYRSEQDFIDKLVALEKRISALERTPQLTSFAAFQQAIINLKADIFARSTTATITGILIPNATENTSITMSKGYRLYSIQTSQPARVRLYETSAQRTSDLGRAIGTDPTGDAGVTLDFVTTNALVNTLSPLVDGANLEIFPSSSIPMAVTNTGSVENPITVTLVWIRTE